MQSVTLHILAFIIWCFAIIAATGVGSSHAKGDGKKSNVGMALTAIAALIAFILQVIA